MQAMPDVLASQDPRVQEAFQDHMQQHQRYMQAASGQAGQGQGQPGPAPPQGAPGNQANSPMGATPSLPGLQAGVMGGPGGPVA
jgi:hypothetical protein